MEKLTRLFGRSIRFVYHGFDRIVIRGYLSTLSRPENIVDFFRTIKQVECIGNIFGWRITKRTKGKHQVVLDQMDHGHHVLRAYSKNAFVKQYEKDNTFLRIETCSNNLKDFRHRHSREGTACTGKYVP